MCLNERGLRFVGKFTERPKLPKLRATKVGLQPDSRKREGKERIFEVYSRDIGNFRSSENVRIAKELEEDKGIRYRL